jgi:hypothetical protein
MVVDINLSGNQLRDLGIANRERLVLNENVDRRYAHLKPGDEERLLTINKPKQVDKDNRPALSEWQSKSQQQLPPHCDMN